MILRKFATKSSKIKIKIDPGLKLIAEKLDEMAKVTILYRKNFISDQLQPDI